MSHINLREEKERDFLLAYEEELKELGEDAPFVPRDEIIFRTLHSGRGRFYVSFEEAARQVKRIYNRRPLKCRTRDRLLCIKSWPGWLPSTECVSPGRRSEMLYLPCWPKRKLPVSFSVYRPVV